MKNALKGKIIVESQTETKPINVALISHGYNIYDDRACMKIFEKLEKMDVKVFTSLQLTEEQMEDVNYGFWLAKEMGKLDVGQSVVIKDKMIMAVEAIEGTDIPYETDRNWNTKDFGFATIHVYGKTN